MAILQRLQNLLNSTRAFDWLGPLALRLYLVPIFWMAGTTKLSGWENTVAWFGNPDWGLGLPFPFLMATLAVWTEILGAVSLLLGVGVRWLCVPMMFTMIVAAVSVHLQNGWLAIAEGKGIFATERTEGAITRLGEAKEILREHSNLEYLTENGSLVMLNNGIEFAATYFIMLLALFFIGAGRYVSIDYWIAERLGNGGLGKGG